MYQDAVAAIPEGSSLEMIERKGGSGGNVEFANLCDYMDRQIAQSVLGQNLTSDVSSGSLAAAEVHAAVKDEIVEDDAKIVERFFADLIRTIRDVNFPSSKLPKFKLERPSKIDATLADRDEKLKNLGVGFTRSYFERSHGLNSDDFVLEGEPGAPAPASPTAGSGADFAEWNQGSGFDDQDAIDRLGDHLADPARSNAVAAEFVDPIIKLVEESSSYSEALGKLSEIYPKLSTDKLEATLASALFVSNALGNLKE
jgi:phage gp29-like protein